MTCEPMPCARCEVYDGQERLQGSGEDEQFSEADTKATDHLTVQNYGTLIISTNILQRWCVVQVAGSNALESAPAESKGEDHVACTIKACTSIHTVER